MPASWDSMRESNRTTYMYVDEEHIMSYHRFLNDIILVYLHTYCHNFIHSLQSTTWLSTVPAPNRHHRQQCSNHIHPTGVLLGWTPASVDQFRNQWTYGFLLIPKVKWGHATVLFCHRRWRAYSWDGVSFGRYIGYAMDVSFLYTYKIVVNYLYISFYCLLLYCL